MKGLLQKEMHMGMFSCLKKCKKPLSSPFPLLSPQKRRSIRMDFRFCGDNRKDGYNRGGGHDRGYLMILLFFFSTSIFGYDPCAGKSALLNIVDRPTAADSACVVPQKEVVIESGLQYQKLKGPGYAENFPEAVLRFGLPFHNEFVWVLPNYIHQSLMPHSGATATTVGIKHEIGYNTQWLGTVESLITLPTGSPAFGSESVGAAVNGIISYTPNTLWNISFMLGVTSQTESHASGGERFQSVNPDWVLTYNASSKLNFYLEVYGQSKTAPSEGSGFNTDGGVLYLLHPNISVDFELGQRLSGDLGGFSHYVGAGISFLS